MLLLSKYRYAMVKSNIEYFTKTPHAKKKISYIMLLGKNTYR